jgi:GT2 family glycosyltransferase
MAENLGFAGGCNAGARDCIGRGADWVWFLNNDARVEPDTLSLLIANAAKQPQAAALGAVVYTPSGQGYVPNGGGEIDFKRGKTYERKQPEPGAETLSCEWLSGCNLLVDSRKFESVGGFDEQYFLYFEDTDLCFRLRQAGWQCLLVPQARVEHAGGASTEGDRQTWRRYYYTRNRLLFFGSHLSKPRAVLPFMLIGMHLLRHTLTLPWRGENGRRQLRAELLGLSDYLHGRLGKAQCLDW